MLSPARISPAVGTMSETVFSRFGMTRGVKPASEHALRIFASVRGLTFDGSLSARDTVTCEMPRFFAILEIDIGRSAVAGNTPVAALELYSPARTAGNDLCMSTADTTSTFPKALGQYTDRVAATRSERFLPN